MDLVGKAKRIRIYLSEGDKVKGVPASMALLEYLRREGAQGATVSRAVSGFGAAGQIHVPHIVDVVQDLPIIVEWIDASEVVERLLPRVEEMVPRGLLTIDDTEILLHRPNPVRDLPVALRARDVMSREVVSVAKDTPLRDVVELMLAKVYRAVPVVDEGVPVGIITNGDLVSKGGLGARVELLQALEKPEVHDVLARLSASSKVASDVMTAGAVVVHAETKLPAVAEVMTNRRLKRLPVVDDRGVLVGIVSRLDLLRIASRAAQRPDEAPADMGLAGDTPLRRIMRHDVPMVHPDTPLTEVFQAVIATRLNRALVVDDEGRVLGLVTDAELLDRVTPSLRPSALRSLMHRLPFAHPREQALAEQHARARRAQDLMTKDVPTATEDTLLTEAIARMLPGNHKVLAVIDAGRRLIGIVDRADLLHGLVPKS
jgi:CBS domain-containing protein